MPEIELFMRHDSGFYRLVHFFSPKVWLAVALVSLLLAGASSWVLLSHLGGGVKDGWYSVYDSAARFVHETIRLTFRTDKQRAAVFVAPVGLLNPKADFNWIESYQDFKPRAEDTASEPKAPAGLLDPDWKPTFSGYQEPQ